MRLVLHLYPGRLLCAKKIQLPRTGQGQRRRVVKLHHPIHSLDKVHSPPYLITASLTSIMQCHKARAFRPALLHVLLAQR
jgi:hypothetical protein